MVTLAERVPQRKPANPLAEFQYLGNMKHHGNVCIMSWQLEPNRFDICPKMGISPQACEELRNSTLKVRNSQVGEGLIFENDGFGRTLPLRADTQQVGWAAIGYQIRENMVQ